MLHSSKVVLLPPEESFASQLLPYVNDMSVTQYITIVLPQTLHTEKQWLNSASQSSSDIVLAIGVKESKKADPKIIGTVGLHNINWIDRRGTFGIVIGDKRYWSGGYGTDVALLILYWGFNSLNLLRIDSSALAFNTRSIALHKKCGFVEEVVERKSVYKNGTYHNLIRMGLLKEDFMNAIQLI